MNRFRVIVIGSTGSIGTQAMEVLRKHHEEFEVVALTAHQNVKLLMQQIQEFHPQFVGVSDPLAAKKMKENLPKDIQLFIGETAHAMCASLPQADIVLIAVTGFSGLAPLVAAIQARHKVCVANKESLVCGGKEIRALCEANEVELIPVDSEHSAIFQALKSGNSQEVHRILLTCSGGPFRTWDRERIAKATAQDAYKHPTWTMGKKITIDSATLANKGLEIMEAKWLFGVDIDQIEVVIHPQSIVHSMVEFCDYSVIAQLGKPDMRTAIQYAFTYPQRKEGISQPLNICDYTNLTFEKPDFQRFPCLELAIQAARCGGIAPIAYNAANEIAAQAFMDGKISFYEIADFIEKTLNRFYDAKEPRLEEIYHIDREIRQYIRGTMF